MSSKQSRKTSSATLSPGSALRQEVERLIQKDRLKDAVKQAKLCFKEEDSPENRRLLEHAYFLRARQLLKMGMPDSALEVAQHLLEFGITSGEWVDEFVRLLMSLGLSDDAFRLQARSGSPELKDQLMILAADQAVIHPERMQDVSAEIAREAGLIREALAKIHAKDDAAGLLLLRDLPRSSPLSDWKFFVRGLAAHYRGDTVETQANWDRLDSSRQSYKIAQRLRGLARKAAAGFDDGDLEVLEKEAFGEPVLARLAQMRTEATSQDWDKVFRLLGSLRFTLRRIDRKLAERLTRGIFGRLVIGASELDELDDVERLLGTFTRLAEPMAIDPNWNRFWAIGWDVSNCEDTCDFWLKFIDDLESIPAFTPAERTLAQAMVLCRVAVQSREQAESISSPRSNLTPFRLFLDPEDEREVERLKKQTIECLERSIALAPLYLPAHRMLINAHASWKNASAFEAAATRLLAAAPDDLETLELMVNAAVERDDQESAMAFVQRARKLKPLDLTLRDDEWSIRVGLARKHAVAGRWDAGREQFRAADDLLPDHCSRFDYLARKVLFEAKAGKPDESDRFLQDAQAKLPEPTPLWLSLAIESIRYGMTRATQNGYAELWIADLKKRCRSETAGAMALLLRAYLAAKVDYPGRADHVAHLVAYLQRTTRLKFRQVDIEQVCDFLFIWRENPQLLDKLLNRGLKLHPGSVMLHFHAGSEALTASRPPFLDPRAIQHMETALKLGEASSVASETALLPLIKKTLTMIKECQGRVSRGMFGGGGPYSSPMNIDDLDDFFDGAIDDDFDGDFDEDDVFDDEFDDEPRPIPSPQPKSKNKKKKSGKKR